MGFRERKWEKFLDTSGNDLMEDFFVPALKSADVYDRGVGYFSSGWLSAAAEGMAVFAANGGKARWITSPILGERDWEALRSGYEARRDEILHNALMRNIESLEASLSGHTASALAWMIADNLLDFKLAVPRQNLDGEFHDKFGYFVDSEGDVLAFHGSYNESIHGLSNYESIKVFPSWEPSGADYFKGEQQRFQRIWDNEDPNIAVYDIPEAAKARILKLRTKNCPYNKERCLSAADGAQITDSPFYTPAGIELRPYQKDAANAWFKNGGRGILMIATGGGKTLTSLFMAQKIWQECKRLVLIVTCPYVVLAEQWQKEMRRFGLEPIVCCGSRSQWMPRLKQACGAFSAGVIDIVDVPISPKYR